MFVAISGTPGVGKSTAGRELEAMGFEVIFLDDLAEEQGFIEGREKGTKLVNVRRLRNHLRKQGARWTTFLVSHYSHLMDCEMIVVLRCHPTELGKRLKRRRWAEAKVRENVEAEALDVITIEALENCRRVYELDATGSKPGTVANNVLRLVRDRSWARKHLPGRIDWSGEVLKWF